MQQSPDRSDNENREAQPRPPEVPTEDLQPVPRKPYDNSQQPEAVLGERLVRTLRRELPESGEADAEPEDLLREALLVLAAQRRNLRSPETRRWGSLHLRSMQFWRQRQRRVCDAVDRTLAELLAPNTAAEAENLPLRQLLEGWIDRLPTRCRNLLRLRYGLEVKTDQVAVKLGSGRGSVRKLTSRCLEPLAREVLESLLPHDSDEL